jgi:diguanylate cyclase (GGDEF)-like protein
MTTKLPKEKSINELYFCLLRTLSSYETHTSDLSDILKDVCIHFGFGCGLVYEANHTNTLFLKERFFIYHTDQFMDEIDLMSCLSPEELACLVGMPIFFSSRQSQKNSLNQKLSELFHVNTIFIIPIKDEAGKFIGFVAMLDRRSRIVLSEKNINTIHTILTIVANYVKLRIYQKKTENIKNSLNNILDYMGIDIYVTDYENDKLLYANKSISLPFGGQENMIGKVCWKVFYGSRGQTKECDFCPKRRLLDATGTPTKVYSWEYRKQSEDIWFRAFAAAFRWVDGRLAHIVTNVDITENKRNENIIRQLADYDMLTKLPNRRRLLYDCDESIKRMAIKNQTGYFIFFDLDNFKLVNDTMGHSAGDELLINISEALQKSPITRDRVYRHGGDEFIVLCENTKRDELDKLIDFILNLFREKWQVAGQATSSGASIGIACYPADGSTAGELLRKADIAMYNAKRSGRNTAVFYNPKMEL